MGDVEKLGSLRDVGGGGEWRRGVGGRGGECGGKGRGHGGAVGDHAVGDHAVVQRPLRHDVLRALVLPSSLFHYGLARVAYSYWLLVFQLGDGKLAFGAFRTEDFRAVAAVVPPREQRKI